jgi:hypothetical protein
MKTKYVLLCVAAGLLCGCTHLQQREMKLSRQLAEESKALTTGVVDVLELQPAEERDRFTETALTFARQDQRIEGLPLKPFDARALLEVKEEGSRMIASTNGLGESESFAQKRSGTPWKYWQQGPLSLPVEVRKRFAYQDQLRAKEFMVKEKLMDFGVAHEEERNERIKAWTKWLGGGSLLVGGLVALCIFFPMAIPIVGRILGWLVGKIPGVAGAVGVVSTKAFDAVVAAIEKTKGDLAEGSDSRMGNEMGGREAAGETARSMMSELHLNLSRVMDAEHKALVRKRKGALA